MNPSECPLSNLELLEIQAEMGFDGRGQISDYWGVTLVAAHGGGQRLYLGSELPPPLADELQAAVDRASQGTDPSVPPPALADCERLLNRANKTLCRTSGNSYLISEGTRFTSAAELTLSTSRHLQSLR